MTEAEQNQEDAPQPSGLSARLSGRFNRGRQAVRQGIERADEALTSQAERVGMSEQLDSARQTLRTSSEVLTGADIRQFDEFTDAVTRVVLGMHRDQADMAQRMTTIEQSIDEIRQTQAQLADRMASIERMLAGQAGSNSDGSGEASHGIQ